MPSIKIPKTASEELRQEAIDQANRYADTDTVKRAVGTTQLHKIVVGVQRNGYADMRRGLILKKALALQAHYAKNR